MIIVIVVFAVLVSTFMALLGVGLVVGAQRLYGKASELLASWYAKPSYGRIALHLCITTFVLTVLVRLQPLCFVRFFGANNPLWHSWVQQLPFVREAADDVASLLCGGPLRFVALGAGAVVRLMLLPLYVVRSVLLSPLALRTVCSAVLLPVALALLYYRVLRKLYVMQFTAIGTADFASQDVLACTVVIVVLIQLMMQVLLLPKGRAFLVGEASPEAYSLSVTAGILLAGALAAAHLEGTKPPGAANTKLETARSIKVHIAFLAVCCIAATSAMLVLPRLDRKAFARLRLLRPPFS